MRFVGFLIVALALNPPNLAHAQLLDPRTNAFVSQRLHDMMPWQDCLLDFALKVAASNREAPNTIADAAFALCLTEENQAYRTFTDAGDASWKDYTSKEAFPQIKKTFRDKIIGTVLLARRPRPKGPPRE